MNTLHVHGQYFLTFIPKASVCHFIAEQRNSLTYTCLEHSTWHWMFVQQLKRNQHLAIYCTFHRECLHVISKNLDSFYKMEGAWTKHCTVKLMGSTKVHQHNHLWRMLNNDLKQKYSRYVHTEYAPTICCIRFIWNWIIVLGDISFISIVKYVASQLPKGVNPKTWFAFIS